MFSPKTTKCTFKLKVSFYFQVGVCGKNRQKISPPQPISIQRHNSVICWKHACWSEHVCDAVIRPSHWSDRAETIDGRSGSGWDRDTIPHSQKWHWSCYFGVKVTSCCLKFDLILCFLLCHFHNAYLKLSSQELAGQACGWEACSTNWANEHPTLA